MTSNPEAAPAGAFKPKKSVALSGVTAGNTALCTVGRTGNDLHYRGYDILDIATQCEFEEIAHLLVHETLPNRGQLAAYKQKLKALRVPPAWRDVHLATTPRSAIQAWGFDARGRKQYRYNDLAVERRELRKYHRVRQLAKDMPRVRRALHADAPGPFLKRIAFRHTPVENCGGGRICVPFSQWEQAWTTLRSS